MQQIQRVAAIEKSIPEEVSCTVYSFDKEEGKSDSYPFLDKSKTQIEDISASDPRWKSGKKIASGKTFKSYHGYTNPYDGVGRYTFR